jgi:D-ornithine 4,5-aminomutase subunit alpha
MQRHDDFEQRRQHLKKLSDDELHVRFWELAEALVDPLLELGRKYTTPSIERSVLLRMGFSSIEAKALVQGVMEQGLMGKGAGHVVYKLARDKGLEIREAGLALVDGKYWDEVALLFEKEKNNAIEIT